MLRRKIWSPCQESEANPDSSVFQPPAVTTISFESLFRSLHYTPNCNGDISYEYLTQMVNIRNTRSGFLYTPTWQPHDPVMRITESYLKQARIHIAAPWIQCDYRISSGPVTYNKHLMTSRKCSGPRLSCYCWLYFAVPPFIQWLCQLWSFSIAKYTNNKQRTYNKGSK
jgi:hypothetical protein